MGILGRIKKPVVDIIFRPGRGSVLPGPRKPGEKRFNKEYPHMGVKPVYPPAYADKIVWLLLRERGIQMSGGKSLIEKGKIDLTKIPKEELTEFVELNRSLAQLNDLAEKIILEEHSLKGEVRTPGGEEGTGTESGRTGIARLVFGTAPTYGKAKGEERHQIEHRLEKFKKLYRKLQEEFSRERYRELYEKHKQLFDTTGHILSSLPAEKQS